MAANIRVILLGLGGVGRDFLRHILSTREYHLKDGERVSVRALCDSKVAMVPSPSSLHADGELSDASLAQLIRLKESGAPLTGSEDVEVLQLPTAVGTDRDRFMLTLSLRGAGAAAPRCVFVDCTASESLGSLLAAAVSHGHAIVLANKKPLTGPLALYDQLRAAGRRLRYESSCGAGLPILVTLARMAAAGDPIKRIAGAFSGTLGFVMSGLEEGQPLSEVVLEAKAAGYTEPDPRDDLGGMDVARKALILARTLGWRLSLSDVEVESLFPPEMGPDRMSVAEFLHTGLPQLDQGLRDRVQAAASAGTVLRYTATVADNKCRVGVAEVPKDSPLGRLRGSDNLVEITSRCYQAAPLVIQGAGAGNDTTAAGVLADVMDLQDIFLSGSANV